MRRRRPTVRFFLFLAILLVGIALVVRFILTRTGGEEVIITWSSSVLQRSECLIVRDETVTESEETVRIEYLGKEGTEVSEGDTIANLFTTGYTESLLARLETTRSNIRSYHRTLLGTINDDNLDRLETIIHISADDFKNLVTQQTRGNLQTVIEQLETAMVNRQEYLRANKRDDTRLTALYDEENSRMTSIQSWRKVATADRTGVLSFYLDGYEVDLNPSLLDTLTPSDVRTVLNGGKLANTQTVLNSGVYRIIDQDNWYVVILTSSDTWSPVIEQEYYLQFEGFEDLSFTAKVVGVQKSGTTIQATFKMQEPIGPLIYQRTGVARLSISLQSLAVRSRAISEQGGQTGVWLYDVEGGTFVQVNVLNTDGDIALIQPVSEGALQPGQRVLVK